jgi:hypothetical protein
MSRVAPWLWGLAMLGIGGCDAIASRDRDGDCNDAICPDRVHCAAGATLVHLEGECCPSCEATPVDAGNGCLCAPDRDPVCGEDLQPYHNACFARCAAVDVRNAGACPSRAQFPDGNYGESCADDDTCDAPYECLPAAHGDTLDPARTICATQCESVDDCPKVVTDHCGDQTLCTDGVCGFFLCA